MMERKLDISVVLEKDGTIKVEMQDIESGLSKTIINNFSPDEHPEFDAAVGEELYSWLTLMADEMELEADSEPERAEATKLDFSFLSEYEPTDIDITVEWYDDSLSLKRFTATAAAWFSDWYGECEMCPDNDTTLNSVTVVTLDRKVRKIVFMKNDSADSPCFEDLMEAIRPTMVYHHWDDEDEDYIWCGEAENSEEPRYFIGIANAMRYIEQNDVPYAKAVECIGICKECGQPVFPSREYGVWGYCHHCDTCYAGPEDL